MGIIGKEEEVGGEGERERARGERWVGGREKEMGEEKSTFITSIPLLATDSLSSILKPGSGNDSELPG